MEGASRSKSNQVLSMSEGIPKMIICRKKTEEEPPYVSPEDLIAMKTMVQEVKQDRSIFMKNFTLPDDLIMEQSRNLCPQDQQVVDDKKLNGIYLKCEGSELNEMKTMVQKAKQDPSVLVKNFTLPDELLIEQSRNLCLQNQQFYDKRPNGVHLKYEGSELNATKTMIHVERPRPVSSKNNYDDDTLLHKLFDAHSAPDDTTWHPIYSKAA